ncbi:hypothetical protein C0Q70_08144 [Pomacea canaliculata]|uniref:Sulfatase N-terminal domain-containing protein n=1 Tax=Pomacea canaliculata TaxID=400727 RepID=A0A2T7PH02_POMCA|nr:hypothetical protein C0Q70_08144 [Pomacea canaliculata]
MQLLRPRGGVTFNQSYVLQVCAPTRSALLTARACALPVRGQAGRGGTKAVCPHNQNTSSGGNKIHALWDGVKLGDQAIGDLRDVLISEGIYNNTIMLTFADNGGPLDGGGSNWPLRGQKSTFWEGGMRSFTVLTQRQTDGTHTTSTRA